MVNLTQSTVRLVILSVLWALVRFTQFVLELAELNWEACEVSNAELFLQVKIRRLLHPIKV